MLSVGIHSDDTVQNGGVELQGTCVAESESVQQFTRSASFNWGPSREGDQLLSLECSEIDIVSSPPDVQSEANGLHTTLLVLPKYYTLNSKFPLELSFEVGRQLPSTYPVYLM